MSGNNRQYNTNSNYGGGNQGFDLSKYETVKQRKTRLRNDYPNSIIYPMQISGVHYANHFVVYMALIWKDVATRVTDPIVIAEIAKLGQNITADNAGIVAGAIGLMLNADSVGYSLSIAGGAKADRNAWVENCEESAAGRALDNLGYHSGSASQEEMLKVQQTEEAQQKRVVLENQINQFLTQLQGRGTHILTQLHQQCVMNTKQFTYLHELTLDQLQIVYGILEQAARQSA